MAAKNYQNSSNSGIEGLNSNISNNIYRIRQNVGQFTQLGKLIGTAKDNDSVRNNIHQIFQNTNEIAKQANVYLKQLSNIKSNDSELAFNKSKRALESELENYSRLQKEVAEKIRKTVLPSQVESNNPFLDESEDNENSMLLKQEKLHNLDQRFDMVKDRETKIQKIESDILDINSIMRDLSTMVNEQTSLIDNISSNVEATNETVESANVQLKQANRYASKYRKKICILILIILVVMIALGLIIYFSIKK